jgi:hypothetical protein
MEVADIDGTDNVVKTRLLERSLTHALHQYQGVDAAKNVAGCLMRSAERRSI